MKIARYEIDGRPHHGILRDAGRLDRLQGSPFDSLAPTGVVDTLAQVRLLAPVASPRVIGVGLNYAAHAREANMPIPTMPMLFMKPGTAVIGPDEAIVYPREGRRVDYECELAVVMGRKARRLSEAEALGAVLGYTCGNDVSERPIQFAEMKMGCLLIGKGFDTFCPLGPWIETDLDPGSLRIATRVNGSTRQDSNTCDLVFSVPRLVSYISQAMTLLPGDVILTGTPAGIGPLQPGDVVEIDIEGIGVLRNHVIAEPA